MQEALNALLEQLLALRVRVLAEAQERFATWQPHIQRPAFAASAHNLATYLAMRHHDLRDLQHDLRPWGLSSLGRMEAQAQANLDAVIATLAQLVNRGSEAPPRPTVDLFREGERLLEAETELVLGPAQHERRVRLMVTLPSEAAQDAALVRALVQHGMEIARINCAHDTPDDWARMAANVRAAAQSVGVGVRVAMDLGGPKSRTAEVMLPKKYRIVRGDRLLLRATSPTPDERFPLQVRCTLVEAVEQARIGGRVWFDDGKIGATIIERGPEGLVLSVTHASSEGERLKDDKGINFPDTELALAPLTDKDREDLPHVARLADMINYSFVQTGDDVRLLQEALASIAPDRARELAIIAKIETARAIRHLPEILVAIGGVQPCGVMIARGDMAVELGFERMAELQEEILWICEAAHIPVIWATQVLETLAKEGRATRAEMTDAAMAQRAEAVMLNKGPYILDAMDILDGVLRRMEAHQHKKTPQLRPLGSF